MTDLWCVHKSAAAFIMNWELLTSLRIMLLTCTAAMKRSVPILHPLSDRQCAHHSPVGSSDICEPMQRSGLKIGSCLWLEALLHI